MDAILSVFSFIQGLGVSVMMPILLTILGCAFGAGFGKSLRAGLTVGIGFIGLNGELNQAITIRTFVSRNNELWFQAGGGIVARSQDEYELQEVNNKLGALKKAIDLAVKLKN